MVLVLTPLVLLGAVSDRNFTFDARSASIDGQRKLILSGAVHYARMLPSDWPLVLDMAVEMGLNAVQTYVMWNFHEPARGQRSWAGRANLTQFIALAAERGLLVAVRIGPYVCGEYQFGGLPIWLRAVDDIGCFRCSDPIWKRESAAFVAAAVEQVRPMLASAGGPVIMLQIENEYNGNDVEYLEWDVDMARKLTAGSSVPWNLCHDHKNCAKVNHRGPNGSYTFNALCTINGFWMEETESNPSQPSPKWIDDHRSANPGQPTVWTEDQGWFDQWQVAQRVRLPTDQIYGIARFFAFGGSWHNFYMLTGGNNYGRQAGGDVVTAYAPDTAIDFLLLRHFPRFAHYGDFFRALRKHERQLLESPLAPTVSLTCDSAQPDVSASAASASAASASASAAAAAAASSSLVAAAAVAAAPPPFPTLSVVHCSDDDPAHPGTLDAPQQWRLEPATSTSGVAVAVTGGTVGMAETLGGAAGSAAGGVLVSHDAAGAEWCVGLDGTAATKASGVGLLPCDRTDARQKWVLNVTSKHLQSVSTSPCTRPSHEGELCLQCLDLQVSADRAEASSESRTGTFPRPAPPRAAVFDGHPC